MLDLVDDLYQQGLKLHKSGKVELACQVYTLVLNANPEHSMANHNMGALAVDIGKVQEALPFFEAALEANADVAQFWVSYIDALINVERIADAQAVFGQAKSNGAKGDGFDKLEQRLNEAGQEPLKGKQVASEPQLKQPNILDTLKLDQAISLAKKKAKAGSTEEAKRVYQDILTKFPKNKRAINGLKELADTPVGNASKVQGPPQSQLQALINLYNHGQLKQALDQANILLQQFPSSSVLYNICGAVYKELGQFDASVEAFSRAITIQPDYADAYNNKGLVLKKQGKPEEAIEAYNNVLAFKPEYAEAYNNMGIVLQEQGKLEEAIEAYNKALALKPDEAEIYNNMGNALHEQGKLEEAIEAYNKALALKPDEAEVYINMSIAKLQTNSWKEGIELRKWRWHKKQHQIYKRSFSSREWDGEELIHDKTLLIWAEQGPGDVVIWASCISHYAKICGKIIIECHPKLVELLKRSFPNILIRSSDNRPIDSLEDFDFHVPMETLFG